MSDTRHPARAALGVALAVLGGTFGPADVHAGTAKTLPAVTTATERLDLVTASGTVTLDVEIADTPAKQAVGLMYRTELPAGRGMLFLHKGARELSMWMRNTYILLDMIFIRADGTVHRIAAMTEPHSEAIISSQGAVSAVLEIAGGSAARLGIKPGDKVRHHHFGTATVP